MAYPPTSKWFHWISVGLLSISLPTGFVIQHLVEESKGVFYAVHESAGVTLFLVSVARLWWRLRHPVPPDPALPPLLRRAASGVHHLLYAALILQPLLGFFLTNAFGFPLQGETAYLGLIDFPRFMATDEALGNLLGRLHRILGWTILGLLGLHIGAVIFHQAIRKDGTLLRMV